MDSVDLVELRDLMALTSGHHSVAVGLLDGPVAVDHPDLAEARISAVGGAAACADMDSDACAHGTAVAGILVGGRQSAAPAICPGCALLVRPIFGEDAGEGGRATTPDELADAISECVEAGARVLNLSASTVAPTVHGERTLEQSLDRAAANGAIVVAAAGSEGSVGSWAITRHRSVIPVAAYDSQGRPTSRSNLSGSLGRRGLGAPGEDIETLCSRGGSVRLGGASLATAFVTGTIALLWSLFPDASSTEVRRAVIASPHRNRITPPLLEAAMAHRGLAGHRERGRRRPLDVRLPGFVADEPLGLGEVMKRATSVAGIRPCGGCAQRAARLNSWVAFTGRKR